MKTFFEEISISTSNRTEVVDITRDVEEITKRSTVTNGPCIIHSVHSTTAIIVNEHEAGLLKDVVKRCGRTSRKEPDGTMIGWMTTPTPTSHPPSWDQRGFSRFVMEG